MKDLNLFTVIPYKDELLQLEKPVQAILYFKNHSIDLLSSERINYGIDEFLKQCDQIKIENQFKHPRVMHLFYELGFLFERENDWITSQTPLAIDISYSNYKKLESRVHKKIKLKKNSSPDEITYYNSFKKGYEELLEGNCYQFNLTFPYEYLFENDYSPYDFIYSLWDKKQSRGAFGSATYIPTLEKLFFSNSPECLFQLKNSTLSSMPIKGTLKHIDGEDWRELWKKLTSDKKSQAELYMISDLLRNDLSRIEEPRAKIVKKKSPKLVPGLIHQYSQIDVILSPDVSLKKILENLYPGGSVTGAPKRRAMRLLHLLEGRERNFYCGSTILLFKSMKSASINIRSAEISLNRIQKKLSYQAGGGITLLSNASDEFQEMTYKHNSFIDALTL